MFDSVLSHRRQPTRLPITGILQARTLEWVAISYSNVWKWKVKVKLFSRIRLLVTPWTTYHASPLMGFSRQEYWTGVPLPSPPFHYRRLKCKSRKSRNTWSNRNIWSWSTEWSRAKANRVLPRECTGHSKHLLPAIQENALYMNITRWLTLKSDWLYSLQPKMEELYTVSKNKTRSRLWLRSWTP